MRCDEVMKREVVCAKPGDTVEDAARMMKLRNVGFLPVCDDDGNVYGTITDRDIVIRASRLTAHATATSRTTSTSETGPFVMTARVSNA